MASGIFSGRCQGAIYSEPILSFRAPVIRRGFSWLAILAANVRNTVIFVFAFDSLVLMVSLLLLLVLTPTKPV